MADHDHPEGDSGSMVEHVVMGNEAAMEDRHEGRRQRISALKQELVGGDLLTTAEVADILDIHPRTVGEYIRDGKLAALQLGGSWRISENALRSFVHGQARPVVTGGLHCSFCGKDEHQVQRLVAGPRAVYICNDCIGLCNDILTKEDILQPR